MDQYVHVLTRHVGPMAATSKEEKPTAPLMPAVQPATGHAGRCWPGPRSRPCSRPSNLRQCSRSTSWAQRDVLSALLASSGCAHCA